jgi:hypothetical protein
MAPEQTPVSAYTHPNFALEFIDPSGFIIASMAQDQVDLYRGVTRLNKLSRHEGLDFYGRMEHGCEIIFIYYVVH